MVGRASDRELVTLGRPVATPETLRPEVMGPRRPEVIGPRRPEVMGSRMPPRRPPLEDVEFPPLVGALVLLGVKVNATDAFQVGAGAEVVFAKGALLSTVTSVVRLRTSTTW
jgi:hypothetical protein